MSNNNSTTAPTSGEISIGQILRSPATGAFVGMVIVFLIFTIFGYHRNFLTIGGIANWMNFASTIGIIALPVGILMIAGELDISVGAVLPASAMTLGITSGYFELPMSFGIALTLAIGALIGLVNGLLVTRTQVPSFIVTLATLFAVGGLTLTMSVIMINNTQVSLYSPDWAKALFGTRYFGFRSTVYWWLAFIIIYFCFLHKSPWGNWVFAVGGDQESARNAGIPTAKFKIALFMLCSVSTAFAGICLAVQFNSATSASNFTLIFNTIIAAVVGGVLLNGGFGTIIGIVFGTMTLAIVQQGINYTEIDRNLSALILGAMLLIAVLMNGTFQKFATRMSVSKDDENKDDEKGDN